MIPILFKLLVGVKITLVKLVKPEKQLSGILVTLVPIVILANVLQPENILDVILFTLLPTTTDVNCPQLANALLPRLDTLFGIVIFCKPVF